MKAFKIVILLLGLSFCHSLKVSGEVSDFPRTKIRLPAVEVKDTAKINSLTRKGFKYIASSAKIRQAKECIDSAVMICEKKNIEIPALLHLLLAEYHYNTGDFRSASEEALQALKQSEAADEYQTMARTMVFLGRYYHRTGFYQESIEYYNKSISLAKKNRLIGIIPMSYSGVARLYDTIGDMSEFRKSLNLMAEAAIAENDFKMASDAYYLMGTSYCGEMVTDKRRDFKKADSLLKKSISIALAHHDTVYANLSMANVGWNFYLAEMYDSSIAYYNKSLKYNFSGNEIGISVNSLGNLGTIYRDLGNYDKAIDYYNRSIILGKKIRDWYNLKWVYGDMSQLYIRLKDTARAFENYVLFKQFNDSLVLKQNSQGLADARLRFEADSNNKELQLLSLKLKNNRLLNYGFSGFILLISAIGFLLFRGSKLKAKRRISEMNRKISEMTQANLRQQMNPHFIFNTLNSIQYYMYQHDTISTNNYLTKFSTLMRKILDNSQQTSIPLSDELTALRLYLDLESIRFKDKFEYKITIDEDIDVLMYKIPTMLIQPYVENSLCHGLAPAEGKGYINIDLRLKDNHVLCTIEDNGIGRDAAKKIRQKNGDEHNSLGTHITESRLDLVNALYGTDLKIVYTDLKDDQGKATGTRVEINIPILS